MSDQTEVEQRLGALAWTTGTELDRRILADLHVATRRTKGTRVSRIAAAVGVVLIATAAVRLLEGTAANAYTLEQTIEANARVRSFHSRAKTHTERGWETTEIWVRLDAVGELEQLRMELSMSAAGPKTVVWQKGRAEVWFKTRGMVVTVNDPKMPDFVHDLQAQGDPRVTMRFLRKAQDAGRICLETIEPTRAGEPIELRSTFHGNTDWMDVYRIDPVSRLAQSEESFARMEGEYQLQRRVEYLAYDRPIDPAVFVLDLPEGVVLIDQTQPTIGLLRGASTEQEVAERVARRFFEALVAGDDATAARLAGGLPAEQLRPLLGDLFGINSIGRVIAIGEAVPDAANAGTGFLCVPCDLEVPGESGVEIVRVTLGIRPVEGQPDRWAIGGTCE